MSRRFVFLFLLPCALLILCLVSAGALAPGYLKKKLETATKQKCETCELSIGDLSIDWFHPGHFSFSKVHFSIGEREAVQVVTDADLSVRVSLRAALKKQIQISRLDFSNFVVRVYNGDSHSGRSREKKRPFSIDAVGLKNGKFEYIRHHEGTLATIHVSEINGRIRNIHSDAKSVADGEITAKYEKTGSTKLTVSAHPFAIDPNPDVRLIVHDQDLHDLTDFFDPNAGVLLSGHILDADAHVVVTGNKVHAITWVSYENLDAKIVSEKDRSKVQAYFMTLGTKITMSKKNTDLPREEQTNFVDLTREKNETLVSFILRGLKESAINVASRKPKKDR